MNDGVLIGTICAYSGQIHPVTGDKNNVWNQSGCGSSNAEPGVQNPDVPLTYPEASGWMLCNGRFLGVEAYPELFAVLGYLYGQGTDRNGNDAFRIPDYRGLFLRGVDAGSGLDPEASKRTAPVGVGTSNGIGSLQCDAFQDHNHNYQALQVSAPADKGQVATITSSEQPTKSPNKPARFGPETRSKNVAVNYLIKFR